MMLITIDGPAGTGKSTIAKKLSQLLNLPYYNTGIMYRALTYKVLRNKIDIDNQEQRKNLVGTTTIVLDQDKCFLDKEDVTKHLRTKEVESFVSHVSTFKEVRNFVVELQRACGKSGGIFEGRDMGTTVFPDADLKVFLTASSKVRAQRRFLDKKNEVEVSIEEVEKELQQRDSIDMNRKISPLRQPEDALFIDTSYLSVAEIIHKIETQYHLLAEKNVKPNWFFRFFRMSFKIFALTLYRHKIYGKKNLPKGAAILAPNHASFIDPILLGISIKEPIYYFARKSLFENRFLKFCLRKVYVYPIERGGLDIQAIKATQKFLQEGKKIVLFPEGTRSKDGNLTPFKEGVALIAMRKNTKIVPIYIAGSFKIWPRKKKVPRLFGKSATVIGSSIDPKLWNMYDRKQGQTQLTNALQKKVQELKDWYHNGQKGPVP